MSCNVCYMSGYGISYDDLFELLKEEVQDKDCFDIVDEIEDDFICGFSSPDGQYLYIRDMPPYGEPLFKTMQEINGEIDVFQCNFAICL